MRLGLLRAHVERRAHHHAVGGLQREVGEGPVHRLGQPEVDDLRHRLAVVEADQDVAGLQVPVNDALGVGVLDGLANGNEQREPLRDAQTGFVAIPA